MRQLTTVRKVSSTTLRDFALEAWPYVFIMLSISGLVYEALTAWR